MKIITVFLLLLLPLYAVAGDKALQLAEQGFTSAEVCGSCHTAIYEGWKGSMHANAVTDPIFSPAFREASKATQGTSDRLCLSCHAPTTRVTGDFQLSNPVTKEGVTCDFCHRIEDVNMSAADPFLLDTGDKKWGPLKASETPAHESAYSALFEQARLCGSCHEYVNERGIVILETYSEWKQSPQAKRGQTCQTCHMPKVKGRVSALNLKSRSGENYINSHEAAGGHSVETLKKAVTLKMGEARRSGEKVHAVVHLENVGSGHKVPTGIPTRKLVLKLRALLGKSELYSEERVFQKVLLDDKGKIITKDSDVFLNAYKVKEDNRLEPGKVRSQHFSFRAPAGKPIEIEASLHYVYQPQLIKELEMKVEIDRKRTGISAK